MQTRTIWKQYFGVAAFGLLIGVLALKGGVALSVSASFALNANPPEGEGWLSLFNGETLEGWAPQNGCAHYWVEDGVIVGETAEGSPNSFLATREHYGDFDLRFEVFLSDPLNTGVQIRSRQRNWGRSRFFGPQVEIELSPGQAGFIFGEGMGTGWLSDEPMSDDENVNTHEVFRNGEWNQYRVIGQGPRIQVFINDQKIEDCNDYRIGNVYAEGAIGLQVHSVPKGAGPYQVRWRNLYIRELD